MATDHATPFDDAAFDAAFAAAPKRRYDDGAPVSWTYRVTRGYGYVESATLKGGKWFYKIRQVDNHVGADGNAEARFVFHYEDDMQASTKAAVESYAKAAEHAGFDDFIEVFRAGKHTDHSGHARTWSTGDLDQIVANFDAAQPAPLVVGHPQTDSPAFGWTAALKREGGKLLAKFNQVPQAMADAVREGRYRNRSVKLAHDDTAGWRLIHVGMLGAMPPAVEGLTPIAFEAEPAGETYEFAYLDGVGTSLIARGMQKLRELIIAHFGQDEADQYVPQDDIDQLNSISAEQKRVPSEPDTSQPAAFARPSDEESKMDEQLKADLDAKSKALDAANAKLAEFSAAQHLAVAKQCVESALADGRLTPAQAAGLPEFMATLTAASFEFAAGEEKVGKTSEAFFAEFLAKLPKQIELGRKTDGADVNAGDAQSIVTAAKEYQKAENAKGVEVPWHEAVTHVTHAQAH